MQAPNIDCFDLYECTCRFICVLRSHAWPCSPPLRSATIRLSLASGLCKASKGCEIRLSKLRKSSGHRSCLFSSIQLSDHNFPEIPLCWILCFIFSSYWSFLSIFSSYTTIEPGLLQKTAAMLSAFRRCAASLPRTVVASSKTSLLSNASIVSRSSQQPLLRTSILSRQLHQTLSRRQDGAAHAVRADSPEATSAGPITKFHELEDRNLIHKSIVKTITKDMGLETMTEVQSATINQALQGTDM